jgi:hypothetical protein
MGWIPLALSYPVAFGGNTPDHANPFPIQMNPGLIVPVVTVPEVKVYTGVCMVASTNGTKRLMKSGRPRSTTANFR